MTDLDDALRTMLRERAHDIRTGPAEPAATAGSADHDDAFELLTIAPTHHHRWPIIAAAAAIVALIGGLILTVHGAGHHRRQPAASSPRVPPAATITRSSCTATLSDSWTNVVAAHTVATTGSAENVTVQGLTNSGDAVVTYELQADGNNGTSRIGYVPPGSADIHALYDFTSSATAVALDVAVENDTVLLTIMTGSGEVHTTRLVVITVKTGATRIAARSTTDRTIVGDAYLQDGHVYWEQDGLGASATRRIMEYDVASRRTSIADSDLGLALSQDGSGVEWGKQDGTVVVRSHIPNVVGLPITVARGVLANRFASFATDGTAFAWQQGRTLAWWSRSDNQIVRIPNLLKPAGAHDVSGQIISVAGSFVYFVGPGGPSSHYVVDTRTGAVAPIDEDALYAGDVIFGRAGTFVGAPALVRTGQAPSGDLMRLPVADLPKIAC